MNFEELLYAAQSGDAGACEKLFLMYRPLIIRYSMWEGRFDEDLYQEQAMIFLKCVERFLPDRVRSGRYVDGSGKNGTPMR